MLQFAETDANINGTVAGLRSGAEGSQRAL